MKESNKKTLLAVRDVAVTTLTEWVQQALSDALAACDNSPARSGAQDARLLSKVQNNVVARFKQAASDNFDQLLYGPADGARILDYTNLTLVDNDQLESVIALEGMITHARNCDITEYLRFTTRLNDLFGFRFVDETNNPLDPAQIGEAVKISIETAGLSPDGQLTFYRHFNRCVFHQLESLLQQSNELLKAEGILPDLNVNGRNRDEMKTRRCNSRDKIDPDERAFSVPVTLAPPTRGNQRDVFTLLQVLMHNDVHKVTTSSHLHDSIEATDLLFRAIWDDVTVPESVKKADWSYPIDDSEGFA